MKQKEVRQEFFSILFVLSIFSSEETSLVQSAAAKTSVYWSQTLSLHTADGIIPASLRTKFRKVFDTADIPRMFISELSISSPLEAQDYDFH